MDPFDNDDREVFTNQQQDVPEGMDKYIANNDDMKEIERWRQRFRDRMRQSSSVIQTIETIDAAPALLNRNYDEVAKTCTEVEHVVTDRSDVPEVRYNKHDLSPATIVTQMPVENLVIEADHTVDGPALFNLEVFLANGFMEVADVDTKDPILRALMQQYLECKKRLDECN